MSLVVGNSVVPYRGNLKFNSLLFVLGNLDSEVSTQTNEAWGG
jgi:hypothetical protein